MILLWDLRYTHSSQWFSWLWFFNNIGYTKYYFLSSVSYILMTRIVVSDWSSSGKNRLHCLVSISLHGTQKRPANHLTLTLATLPQMTGTTILLILFILSQYNEHVPKRPLSSRELVRRVDNCPILRSQTVTYHNFVSLPCTGHDVIKAKFFLIIQIHFSGSNVHLIPLHSNRS